MAWRHRSNREKAHLGVIAFLSFALLCFIIAVIAMDLSFKKKIHDLEDELDAYKTTTKATDETTTHSNSTTPTHKTTAKPQTTTSAKPTTTTTEPTTTTTITTTTTTQPDTTTTTTPQPDTTTTTSSSTEKSDNAAFEDFGENKAGRFRMRG